MTTTSANIPLYMTVAGPQPTPPAVLRAALVTYVQAQDPDYTANLPGSLIEDMVSTATGALVQLDQARVDSVNSVSPYAANASLLAQLGVMFGVAIGAAANGSVNVVFSGSVGYVIAPGFLVSDGTNQYAIQDGGVVQASGSSAQLTAIAVNPGSFPIPAGTVTQVVTSVPSGYTLTVTNPQAGVPATSEESVASYRARVLTAWQSSATGVPAYLKTLLRALLGVQARLVSVQQKGTGWEVICGGGDANEVAAAILKSVPDISALVGSDTPSRNVTVSLFQDPDTYSIVFVNPPAQVVTATVSWNTTLTNFTGGETVNQQTAPALQAYINSISVGQPINLLEMDAVFQAAAAPTLDPQNISVIDYVVSINGSVVTPISGTSIIPSDPESYFSAATGSITVTQI